MRIFTRPFPHPSWRCLALLLCLVGLSACSSIPDKPDLARMYVDSRALTGRPPVLIVPGALGSRLVDAQTGEEVWPNTLARLVFSDYEDLALEIDPQTLTPLPGRLVPNGTTDKIAGQDYYGNVQRVLEEVGGYQRATPGQRIDDQRPRYYVFAYDWRQDNVNSVRQLDAFIEQIRLDHEDPELKVDIIAHSMGGLITRYYLRYGTQDVLNGNSFTINNHGTQRIRRAVLLGTPNFGSAGAFATMAEGFRLILGTIPIAAVATFPSTYQVLPHALNNWLLDINGKPIEADVFDAKLWRGRLMSVYSPQVSEYAHKRAATPAQAQAELTLLQRYFDKHIERARRFTWSLSVPEPEPEVRLVVFGGDCLPTPARMVLETTEQGDIVHLDPDQILNPVPGLNYHQMMLEPGDGTVTKASLLARRSSDPGVARHRYSFFPLDHALFLCESHSRLTGNIHFQNNLLDSLLREE